MRKTAKYLLVIALALLVLALALCWSDWRLRAGDSALARWGHRELTVSEEAYYTDRITRILHTWMEMSQHTDYDEEGRFREPYHVFLVFDVERREVWIEDRGQVLDQWRSELPAQMTWAVRYDAGSGADPIGRVVRLKCRGLYNTRRYPEIVWLVGQGTSECLAFLCSDEGQGRSYVRGGPFQPNRHASPRKDGVKYYASMLVSDAEYEQSRLSWAKAGQDMPSGRRLLMTTADENQAPWAKVERKLYQAIEGQVRRAGFRPSALHVQPGPDYSAAHALMQVDKEGLVVQVRNYDVVDHHRSFHSCLMIDYLGSDVWYAKVAPSPIRPPPRPGEPNPVEELPLEFLVSAADRVPSARREWIEKGRAKQRPRAGSPAPWTATLADGTAVQFLGVGEDFGEGKRWWGPDGTPIERPSCFMIWSDRRHLGDRRLLEFVWRVQSPDPGDFQEVPVPHVFDGGSTFGFLPCRDRYGVELRDARHDKYDFERFQEKTTLTVNPQRNDQSPGGVKFKNISLVPGRNQGFEIEVVK